VFASIKGGVGRSTALCVLASFLAFRGKRVLTVDMDLEAPGLGNMLLPGDTLPNFGLLDYLVEQHIGKLDDEFFADMTGASWLGAGRGRVDVIPALGRRSLENPANVLAKIARAYLPGASSDSNEVSSFTDHVSALLDRVALPSKYDVVLIDARAGLHETSAAAVIGLGAEVLLFGVDQAQTLAGYELLFSHLATLPVRDGNDWKDRLTLIQAKASDDHKINSEYAEKIGGLMKKYLWPVSNDEDVEKNLSELEGEFETEWDDESNVSLSIETPLPIIIPESPLFHRFDPVRDGSTLEVGVYKNTFGSFLNTVSEILDDGND
jgi:hypothetical protein